MCSFCAISIPRSFTTRHLSKMAALPDYVLDENAVLKDAAAKWRHGRAPDYSKTRKVYAESTSPVPRTPHDC